MRRASTGYTLIALFVGGFALSASGTTIRVASLPDLPDDVTTVELRWGDANHTSQDVLANGGWKWHWTGWGADTVTFVSPGYAPLPLLVRPWKQTVLYGFDDFEPLPFVIITFPDPPPSTMPDRVKARDKEFRWKLQVSSRLQGASAWENPHWSADEDYYVGDPLVLGGNGADWPEDRSLPAGVSVALVHRPLQPLSLSATRDYRVFVADQHDVIRLSAEITAVEIRAIREPIRIELKEP